MQPNQNPLISVLLPVFNGERYLRAALESVLAQTFRDFECVVINDGSIDGTSDILRNVADSRVKVYDNARNMGLIKSLNRGLSVCCGEYIARMDADDIALPQRLEIQLAAMRRNPKLILLGSRFYRLEGKMHGNVVDVPLSDAQVRWALLFENAFGHSTCMYRRVMPDGVAVAYCEQFPLVEDYELWTRLAAVGQVENLKEPLVWWRDHPASVCATKAPEQWNKAREVSKRELNRLCPEMEWDDARVARLGNNHCLGNFKFTPPGFVIERDASDILALARRVLKEARAGQNAFKHDVEVWLAQLMTFIPLKKMARQNPGLVWELFSANPRQFFSRVIRTGK